MSYISDLIQGNLRSLSDILKGALTAGAITTEDVKAALEAEVTPVPAGGDIYNVTMTSIQLLKKLSQSPDRDMTVIVKKILRSTKYAATTYYTVSGADQNPHKLPIQRLDPSNSQL